MHNHKHNHKLTVHCDVSFSACTLGSEKVFPNNFLAWQTVFLAFLIMPCLAGRPTTYTENLKGKPINFTKTSSNFLEKSVLTKYKYVIICNVIM